MEPHKFKPSIAPSTLQTAETLFYGEIGTNSVWGMVDRATGAKLVAVSNGMGQVVIREDALRTILVLLAGGKTARQQIEEMIADVANPE